MLIRRFQWLLAIIWLGVAVAVYFRDTLLPEDWALRLSTNAWLLMVMAVVFAIWNFVRWYSYCFPPQPMQNPLKQP